MLRLLWTLNSKRLSLIRLPNETEQVQQFAYNHWGKRVDDTIAKNVYRQTLELGKKDTLTVSDDTTVCVYYVGRFLDGFIFDTNIADTAEKV